MVGDVSNNQNKNTTTMTSTQSQVRKASIEQLPSWAISETGDFASFVSALALAGMENRWVRISAKQQRQFFGFAPFGKRAVLSDGNTIRVLKIVSFGADIDERVFSRSDFNSRR